MRVFVTGLTGFVGYHLGQALLAHGHEVVGLVRAGSEHKLGNLADRVEIVHGDVREPWTLQAGMEGADAVIYLVGIIKEDPAHGVTYERLHWEGARLAIDAAQQAGIKRFLLMSANGVKAEGTAYQTTKFHAEEYLRTTDLDWTIFRPSVIFGEPYGRMNFVGELAGPLRFAPIFPIFGDGGFVMQPVWVGDVAEAFVRSLARPISFHRTYCLGGALALTYKEVVETIALGLGRTHLAMPSVPLPLVEWTVALGQHLPGFPITRDQLQMLLEGNACNDDAWTRDLEITPRAFTPDALGFLRHPEPEPQPGVASHV